MQVYLIRKNIKPKSAEANTTPNIQIQSHKQICIQKTRLTLRSQDKSLRFNCEVQAQSHSERVVFCSQNSKLRSQRILKADD